MPHPEMSIIISAHNEENFIEKTLKSIKQSSFKKYELLVICDSCIDSTEKISKKYTKKVFKTNFKNTSKNRNYGAKKSKGKIIAFLDADTTIDKNYLEEIKNSVERGAEYGTATWSSETNSLFGKYWAWGNNSANKRNKTISGNCFITKKAFKEISGFDERMKKGEDTDIGDRLKNKNKKYIFIKHVHFTPSERRYKKGAFKFWMKAISESWLYKLNKKSYKKRFSHIKP